MTGKQNRALKRHRCIRYSSAGAFKGLTWCQGSRGATKARMWKKGRGEGLDSRLGHGGHTWSSLGDEFTCCWVWSLETQQERWRAHSTLSRVLQERCRSLCADDRQLAFLLWEMLRAPKSLNSEDVGEFTGSVEDRTSSGRKQWCLQRFKVREKLTVSAVAEVLHSFIEKTGRATAGSHSLSGETDLFIRTDNSSYRGCDSHDECVPASSSI